MRLLLDTNAFLWFVLDEPNLGKRAREVIGDAANDVEVSPATLWEIAIKIRLGKYALPTTKNPSHLTMRTNRTGH